MVDVCADEADAFLLASLCRRGLGEACVRAYRRYDELFAASGGRPPRIELARRACASGLEDACLAAGKQRLEGGPFLAWSQLSEHRQRVLAAIVGRENDRPLLAQEYEKLWTPELGFAVGDRLDIALRGVHLYSRTLTLRIAAAAPADRPPLRQERRRLHQRAEEQLRRAVDGYTTAAQDPGFDRADLALARLEAMLLVDGRTEAARAALDRLLAEHPASPHIPEAYVVLAEHHFDRGDFAVARVLYEKAEGFPRAAVHTFALYKKGWCQLRLGKRGDARQTFAAVIAAAEDPATPLGKALRDALAREATKDIAALAPERASRDPNVAGGEPASAVTVVIPPAFGPASSLHTAWRGE